MVRSRTISSIDQCQIESVAGWKAARVRRPFQILGSLDGIETGIRRIIRDEPLETAAIDYHGERIAVPTRAEVLRMKSIDPGRVLS